MASTIKVDTIETVAGSGNITLNNNVASLTSSGAISGTIITASSSGAPLIVNSTNSNNNKVIFQNNGSAVSHLGGLSNGVVFGNAGDSLGRLDGDGLKFGTDTAATNGLDDYETGTWVPRIEGVSSAGTATYAQQVGRYTKVGNLVTIVGYLSWSSHTGTGSMIMRGLPYTTTQSGAVYNSLAAVGTMRVELL